jgi:hypothetical protein
MQLPSDISRPSERTLKPAATVDDAFAHIGYGRCRQVALVQQCALRIRRGAGMLFWPPLSVAPLPLRVGLTAAVSMARHHPQSGSFQLGALSLPFLPSERTCSPSQCHPCPGSVVALHVRSVASAGFNTKNRPSNALVLRTDGGAANACSRGPKLAAGDCSSSSRSSNVGTIVGGVIPSAMMHIPPEPYGAPRLPRRRSGPYPPVMR